ncbi:MAG TPA: TonB-dependent receptor [Pyrinomonadaceae bacterium]|nr:TonB-dependent receptor [Pyrinomonadaceae bacterium]
MPLSKRNSAKTSLAVLSSSDVSRRPEVGFIWSTKNRGLRITRQYFLSRSRQKGRIKAGKRALHLAFLIQTVLMPGALASVTTVRAQQPQSRSATLQGRVVDARSGEPIAKVKIVVSGSTKNTTTDESGAFKLEDLGPGEISLYVTTVGYGLVKKTVIVKETDNAEIIIALNQEAATLTEHVTVTAEPYAVTETNAASEQTLNKTELQDLSKVVISDPIRAVQSLPGVTANDDLRAEFAVRGADYRRVGVFLDGVLTDNFLHLASGNADERITFSVINADTINEVSLLSGAFPAKYGDATAGVLLLQTRDGNRIKPAFRISTGLQLGTSGVVDGPLANKRGSWLFAARSSLLDYISRAIDKIGSDNTDTGSVDFSDIEGKVIYDLSTRHRIGLSGHLSGLKFNESAAPNLQDPNAIFSARSRNFLVNGFWDYTANSRLLVQTRIFGTRTHFKSKNGNGLTIKDETRTQFGARSDLNFLVRPAHRIESGVYLRSFSTRQVANFFALPLPGTQVNLASFDRRAIEAGYYLQDTYTNLRRGLSLTGGLRIDHSDLTSQTLVSPRAAMALKLGAGWNLRAGIGRYYQIPEFEKLFGQLGNVSLRAEQATHYNLSLERTFGDRYRALVEFYDREDRDLIFALAEPRLVANVVTFAQFPFRNSLDGHARGLELTFQRRSANRLSGWVTYSYARTRFRETPTGLGFAGDFDQTHTVSTYGSYRFTDTFNVSGQWRYGSGFPIPGFFRLQGPDIFLAGQRNLLRLPSYSRVDVRANKAFLFEKWKLTLSAELLNITNHKNFRLPVIDGINPFTGRVFHHFGETMPVLPALGVAIEF